MTGGIFLLFALLLDAATMLKASGHDLLAWVPVSALAIVGLVLEGLHFPPVSRRSKLWFVGILVSEAVLFAYLSRQGFPVLMADDVPAELRSGGFLLFNYVALWLPMLTLTCAAISVLIDDILRVPDGVRA